MLRNPTILITGFCVVFGLSACNRSKAPKAADSDRVAAQGPAHAEATDRAIEKSNVSRADVNVRPDPGLKDNPLANPVIPQPVYRPDDLRPPRDEAKLAEVGIHLYTSKRLKLYTDIDPEFAQTVPPLIDQVYDAWEDYFGPMPANRAGTDFQMSGYMMRDMALFREFGLVPDELFIEHGRHRRNEFWLPDQPSDYYRRHQVIHEATHCYMTFLPDSMGPVWYMEGMAEYFGSHKLDRENRATFRVMPTTKREFARFDRITKIRDDVAQGKRLTIASIFAFQPAEFRSEHYYAWSWALAIFLDQTPRYRERFQKLARLMPRSSFPQTFNELYESDQRELATEWALFATNLMYGYDPIRAAIDFQPGTVLMPQRTVQVEADRGWQSSGVLVEKGQTYQISATGQFTLANDPKPWVSEPQGISFRYFEGRPIGMLLGCLRTEERSADGDEESMLHVFSIGRTHEFQAPLTGTLYLRLNDAWNSLNDNSGNASVSIRAR